jgi:hypothetical protein
MARSPSAKNGDANFSFIKMTEVWFIIETLLV